MTCTRSQALACAFTRLVKWTLLTLLGGTIAIADLGVMEMCLVSDLSPLTERRNACVEQVKP